MSQYVKKSLPFFLSASDETSLAGELKKVIPGIAFIDGSLWETAKPPIRGCLADCRSSVVYLWDQHACPDLPYQALDDGRARGPTSGVVIQYVRSGYNSGIETSGDMGIGYEKTNHAIAEFVKTVWKVVKAMNA